MGRARTVGIEEVASVLGGVGEVGELLMNSENKFQKKG